jgi:membrane associated rhomboid family serine protease
VISPADTPATFAILALIVVVSALGLTSMPRIIESCLLRPWQVVRKRAYAPIITCGFVHGDFGHLLFNSLTLFFFGPVLELKIGTPRFVALYFIGLGVSSLGTVVKHRDNPEYASLGASGAILAVLFAFIVYYPLENIYLFFAIGIPAALFAFGYLAYTWWASKNARGRINHDAHLDGALTGFAFVAFTDFDAWRRAIHLVSGALT